MAAANKGGDKTTSVGLDWPHTEETWCMYCQEGPWVEPAGEARERGTPAHLEAHKNVSWRREDLRGVRQKTLHKIGSDGEHKWKTYVPLGMKRNDDELHECRK